jgi:RNA polymerase sigma factor (sigma-70 family)
MNEKETIREALSGNRKALEILVLAVKDKIYNLAIRFLWHPADAEDATQEILIKLITNLSSFEGRSSFSTWSYRVAANYLLNLKKSTMEKVTTSFADFADDLKEGLNQSSYLGADREILEDEVKTGCTMGMLLCLSRELRLAFILDTVFELTSKDASEILGITAESYRKRLSRARDSMEHFMQSNCGLINKKNPCRCSSRIQYAIDRKRVNPGQLLFTGKVKSYNAEMENLHTVAGIYKSHPHLRLDFDVLTNIKDLIESKKYNVL